MRILISRAMIGTAIGHIKRSEEIAFRGNKMNEVEKNLMQVYGITSIQKVLYLYKEFRYERLEDALLYAEIDAKRDRVESGE